MCGFKYYFFVNSVFIFFGIFFNQSLVAADLEKAINEQANETALVNTPKPLASIHANYQVKASFFALPITAKIVVEKIEPEIYQASIKLSSPFFKVNQTETARIKQCQVELQHIRSEGSRMSAENWDEKITITWPNQLVTYQDGPKKQFNYQAEFTPTGFTSLFAHQFAALAKPQNAQTPRALTYTQSSKGWRMDFINKGRDESVKNKFFSKSVPADRFVIPRMDTSEEDLPSIWYKPESLGAFPLKMAMKLGMFRIETHLKKIDAKPAEIQLFFNEWGCLI